MMKKNTTNITYSHAKKIPTKTDTPTLNNIQFCQKMTSEEAKIASQELTKKELEKLKRPRIEEPIPTYPDVSSSFKYVNETPTYNNNQLEIHRLMCKYADKQQTLCNQICNLNSKLQDSQDKIMCLRDEKYEVETEMNHFKEVSEAYETDIDDMRSSIEKLTSRVNGCRRQIRNVPFVFIILFFVYTLCLFEMGHRSSHMLMQYGDYRNWIMDSLN